MSVPLFIPPGHAKINLQFRLTNDPDPYMITFGIGLKDSVTSGGQSIITDIFNLAATMHESRGSAAVTLFKAVGQFYYNLEWEPETVEHVGSKAGLNVGTIFPPNCAFLLRKLTNQGGRANRGRFFYPGIRESSADDVGQVLPTEVTAWNTALATFLNGLATHTQLNGMYLLHRPRPKRLEPWPTKVTGLACDALLATQRRRLRK